MSGPSGPNHDNIHNSRKLFPAQGFSVSGNALGPFARFLRTVRNSITFYSFLTFTLFICHFYSYNKWYIFTVSFGRLGL